MEMRKNERVFLGEGALRSSDVEAVKSKALNWRLRVKKPDWIRGILLANLSFRRAEYQALV